MNGPHDDLIEQRGEILEPLDPARYRTLVRIATDANHKLVVSLGGGSAPGLCGNLALARILEELDLRRHVAEVWGTSAGAAVGGAWTSGSTAPEIYSVVGRLNRPGVVDIPWLRLALAFLKVPFGGVLPDGLMRSRYIAAAVQAALKVETFEECDPPFRCIACSDDGHAHRKVFRRGPLFPAIFASMSLPGIVIPRAGAAPAETGYYDGGLVEKTPLLSPLAEHGRSGDPRRLVVIATHFSNETRRVRARGFINRFLQSMYSLENLAWSYQLAEARAKRDLVLILLNPRIDDPNMFDFARLEQDYLVARREFRDVLQDAKIGLTFGFE